MKQEWKLLNRGTKMLDGNKLKYICNCFSEMGTIEKGHKLNNETRMNTVKPGTNWNIYVTVFFLRNGNNWKRTQTYNWEKHYQKLNKLNHSYWVVKLISDQGFCYESLYHCNLESAKIKKPSKDLLLGVIAEKILIEIW